ncbi:hypothetical protein GWI33_000159 [Rhynchophorus ferrugineus]|uniref:Uncharacterized protein n=1 Tax=Rhynchophorus ferrugineus TaxID=354439 RepID=A0A834IY92_RHYFE|nr:hypothetical protein GWI33_000159 [Rhynchophorus ferrugineus]
MDTFENIKKSLSSAEYQKAVTEHKGHNITGVSYKERHTIVTSSVNIQSSSKQRSASVSGYPALEIGRINTSMPYRSIFNNPENKDAVPFTTRRTSTAFEPSYRTAFNSKNTFGTYSSPPQSTKANSSYQSPISPIKTYSLSSTPSVAGTTNFSLPSTRLRTLGAESIPTYSIKGSKLKGKALIINNIKFQTEHERKGAKKDGQDLENTLKAIGFSCINSLNLTAEGMKKKISTFAKGLSRTIDVSIIVIMSHGTNFSSADGKPLRGGYTEIVGTDGNRISIDDVVDIFSENAGQIEGIPKIFIFQCCRGESDQIHVDAVPLKKTQHSDILLAFSTLPGFVSNRHPNDGTWYIQSICEIFSKMYKDHHIEDMLKMVNENLSKKDSQYSQTSTYESRGFKRCFLYPQ